MNNSNLLYALQPKLTNIGTVRETFFYSQLGVKHAINLRKTGDFIVDDKYIFEIGGKNKTQNQIADLPNAFIALDNIEYGIKNKIPIWMFGFLY